MVAKGNILMTPVADLSDLNGRGFFWIQATMKNGDTVSGDLQAEDSQTLTLVTDSKPVIINKEETAEIIGRRISVISKMPRYDELITLRQFEDLLTYLAGLDGSEQETPVESLQ